MDRKQIKIGYITMLNKLSCKKVYVCSPLSAPTRNEIEINMLSVRNKCKVINNTICDVRAWAPHAYLPEIIDDSIPEERALALDFGMRLLNMSDTMYVFGARLSDGMKSEISEAVRLGLVIVSEPNISSAVIRFIDTIPEDN